MQFTLNLSDCSKADLLWIVEHLCSHYFYNGEFYLQQALRDLNYKREQDRLDEAKKHAVVADAARKRWVSLMAPYDGWRLIDIPVDVILEADSAMQEAKTADRKWRQLMGF